MWKIIEEESHQIDDLRQTKTHHGGVDGLIGGHNGTWVGFAGGHGSIADVFIQEECLSKGISLPREEQQMQLDQ